MLNQSTFNFMLDNLTQLQIANLTVDHTDEQLIARKIASLTLRDKPLCPAELRKILAVARLAEALKPTPAPPPI